MKALETGIVPPVPNFRDPDPELGVAQPLEGRLVSGPLRAAAGGRLRLADLDDAAALDARGRRPAAATRTSSATPTGSPTAPRGTHGCGGPAARRIRCSRSCSIACGSSIRVRRTGAPAEPVAAPVSCQQRSSPRRSRQSPHRRRPSPPRPRRPRPSPRRPSPSPQPPRRVDQRCRGAGARHRRRADRLPDRPARPRPRPRGRPRDRHRQAGRGVRGDPRGLRDPAATTA